MVRFDEFTGKPVPETRVDMVPNGGTCETCGHETIDRCPRCGAPQCCPRCCEEARAELEQEDEHGKPR